MEEFRVGDRVQVFLNEKNWGQGDWFEGTVARVEPYSKHRSFHWVELDEASQARLGTGMKLISVLNPKHIRRARPASGSE
jgi:hypothetical protein